ncbi:hypothetical protein [Sandaracinus amylolyticus]|uniref:hypothetical protein n=1 Tax=Sandaracinus amylolyticus TaxID=927083 RepID=UPI001F19B97E|nr:hypothetical protein [Sandaracinus amylolyticus]UJR81608.1 Signal recognition particle receptor protein FtsY [Sandaracinus amylolyticus]
MAYSGASTARQARENLSKALAALQEDPNIPPDVLAVAQNIAQAVGALFEAERASSEPDGKASVKSALGFVSQTLALLQEVRGQHAGVGTATEAIAQTLSMLFPLSTQPSRVPPPSAQAQPAYAPPPAAVPVVTGSPITDANTTIRDEVAPSHGAGFTAPIPAPAASAPQGGFTPPVAAPRTSAPAPAEPSYRGDVPREALEVNIGATTESNFYVGFSGEIAEGGVFAATYNIFQRGTKIRALITLPGNFEHTILGTVRFVRDPMDMMSESEPGMGIQFESLDHEARELILRFIRKRPPMFYDE